MSRTPQDEPADTDRPRDPATEPATLPYLLPHDGPRRIVWVTLRSKGLPDSPVPFLTVDGTWYYLWWGEHAVEVPADRVVHLSAGCEAGSSGRYRIGVKLLAPSDPPRISYFAGGMLTPGSFE